MIGSLVTRVNAFVLALAGFALLFAGDVILQVLVTSYPADGGWVGQILGAALLAIATFNYFHRSALIGGIYGRGIVSANMTFYFMAAIVVWKSLGSERPGPVFWLAATITTLFALVYGWLLLRGPFKRDFRGQHLPQIPGLGTADELASGETNPTIRS